MKNDSKKKPNVTHYLNIKGVRANNKFGLLIKVWKGKELPSEVKCHCQSQHESLLTSKDISAESCHTIYGNTSFPIGSHNPQVTQAVIFFRNLEDSAWKPQPLLNIMSPLILSLYECLSKCVSVWASATLHTSVKTSFLCTCWHMCILMLSCVSTCTNTFQAHYSVASWPIRNVKWGAVGR